MSFLPCFCSTKLWLRVWTCNWESQGSNVFWIFLALLKLHIEERHFQTTQIQIIPFQLPRSKKTSMFQVLKNRLFQASFLKNQVALWTMPSVTAHTWIRIMAKQKTVKIQKTKMGQQDAFKNYIGMSWAMKKPHPALTFFFWSPGFRRLRHES